MEVTAMETKEKRARKEEFLMFLCNKGEIK
jgi:hypothetical protein